jgi:F-type H+-transporting ATPase subunit gamma
MERMLGSLAASMAGQEGAPALMAGTGNDAVQLVVVMTSDRGLCGGFNSTIVRGARRLIRDLQAAGKQVKVLCVGRKGRDQLRRDFSNLIIGTIEDIAKPRLTFDAADRVARRIAQMFEAGEFDVCTIIYNRFKSAMTQIVTTQQLIPFAPAGGAAETGATASYEYEPDEGAILAELLPRNLSVQVYRALLENNASEQGARMTAMDSATRNAGDMINRLTINYNRSRQAYITKELIEIISGAEAV